MHAGYTVVNRLLDVNGISTTLATLVHAIVTVEAPTQYELESGGVGDFSVSHKAR